MAGISRRKRKKERPSKISGRKEAVKHGMLPEAVRARKKSMRFVKLVEKLRERKLNPVEREEFITIIGAEQKSLQKQLKIASKSLALSKDVRARTTAEAEVRKVNRQLQQLSELLGEIEKSKA